MAEICLKRKRINGKMKNGKCKLIKLFIERHTPGLNQNASMTGIGRTACGLDSVTFSQNYMLGGISSEKHNKNQKISA